MEELGQLQGVLLGFLLLFFLLLLLLFLLIGLDNMEEGWEIISGV